MPVERRASARDMCSQNGKRFTWSLLPLWLCHPFSCGEDSADWPSRDVLGACLSAKRPWESRMREIRTSGLRRGEAAVATTRNDDWFTAPPLLYWLKSL